VWYIVEYSLVDFGLFVVVGLRISAVEEIRAQEHEGDKSKQAG
jgi:hypothetical protein